MNSIRIGSLLKSEILASVLLVAQSAGFAATSQSTGQFSITIAPAAKITVAQDNVDLKIRLVQGTSAVLWAANDCSTPGEGIPLTHSGQYHFDVRTVTKGHATQLCVLSSDGRVKDSVSLNAERENTTEGN